MKTDIIKATDDQGFITYHRHGEKIEVYNEELHLFLMIKFDRIEKFLKMLIHKNISKDPDEECADLYIAVDLVDGIKRQVDEMVSFIHDCLGGLEVVVSSEYKPGTILEDEKIDVITGTQIRTRTVR